MFYKDSQQVYRIRELDSLAWLVHGFGTRLAEIPGRFGQLATLKQIHSATCVAASGRTGVLGQGDALLDDTVGSVVAVKTADCIPILLIDDRHRAVAADPRRLAVRRRKHRASAIEGMHERFGTFVKPICTRPSDRASASAVTRWGRKSPSSLEGREGRTSTFPMPTGGNSWTPA